MIRALLLICMVLVAFMSGCSAKLVVSSKGEACKTMDKNGKEINVCEGIPFRTPKPYVATAVHTKLKSGKEGCQEIPFTKFVFLPTGDIYHVNIQSQPIFSSSEFTIELNENGTLEKIVFNADPELSETIQSTAGLVTAIAGLVDKPATTAEDDAPEALGEPQAETTPCDVGERITCIQPFVIGQVIKECEPS